MFILYLLRMLVALPVFWLGQLLGMLKSASCLPFLKAAWWIGRNENMGLVALVKIQQLESAQSARIQAAAWLASDPCPGMAAFAGLLALDAGDLDDAGRCRDLCLELGGDRQGLIEWLELILADKNNNGQAAADLHQRLAMRTDLSPLVSKSLLEISVIKALFGKNWIDAESPAKRLWSIEDNPWAATAFWALNRQNGKSEDFQNYLKKIKLTPGQVIFFQTAALFISGEMSRLGTHSIRCDRRTPPWPIYCKCMSIIMRGRRYELGMDSFYVARPDRGTDFPRIRPCLVGQFAGR